MKKKIWIVDDHAEFRSGFQRLLEKLPDTSEILEAADRESALVGARESPPNVIVLNLFLPNNRWRIVEILLQEHPHPKTIVMSILEKS